MVKVFGLRYVLNPHFSDLFVAGADRDMQAAASGRLLPNDAELQYDVAVRLPGENQTQLEARMQTRACEKDA